MAPLPVALLSAWACLGLHAAAGEEAARPREEVPECQGGGCEAEETGLLHLKRERSRRRLDLFEHSEHKGSGFQDTLNAFYNNGSGLVVSTMHHGFKPDSLAPGVPLWSCPKNGTAEGKSCTWHKGRYYASASWISHDLYGDHGVELYQCNKMACGGGAKLLFVYHPATTVFGAAFVADGNTDIDGDMEGASKGWMPPDCSEVAQACGFLHPSDAKARASCLKRVGGDVGKPYTDEFSKLYAGEQEGTLLPYGSKNANITSFVHDQQKLLEKYKSPADYLPDCSELHPPPRCDADSCKAKNCTCNAGGTGYSEFVIRAANPENVCGGKGGGCTDRYKQFVCKNQLPIAIAYVPSDSKEPFQKNATKKSMYDQYMAQIKLYCGSKAVPPLLQFNVSDVTHPFVALSA